MLHNYIGLDIAISVTIYFAVLGVLLWRGWPLRAGLATLPLSMLAIWLDSPEDGGAYGLAFLAMPLALLSLSVILVGVVWALVRLGLWFLANRHRKSVVRHL
jgi:ethanolamine transporter EutH